MQNPIFCKIVKIRVKMIIVVVVLIIIFNLKGETLIQKVILEKIKPLVPLNPPFYS